ncbi:MAG: hypothetical protein QXD23_01550 [Candidatus Micrarchaeaceae archaeon]
MWFFKKTPPSLPEEEYTLDDLNKVLKSLLDTSLKEFYLNCNEFVSSFNNSKKEFIDECKVLEKYEGEPIVEDMWAPNINSIKTQKNSYTKTLVRILEKEYEGSFDTQYGKCKAELSKIEEILGEMLRINSMFKVVVLSYSNELGKFKKIFANMEKSKDKLKLAIEEIQPEYKKYEEIRNKIENLYGIVEETKLMDENISSIDLELNALSLKNDLSTSEKLKILLGQKKDELTKLSNEIHETKVKVSSNLMPLERAARKMDYSYMGKRSITDFIENPEENFNNDIDYTDFEKLLDDLVTLLNSDKIQVKGKESILSTVPFLKTKEFKNQLKSLEKLIQTKKFLSGEINTMENELVSKVSKSKILNEKEKEKEQMFSRKEQLQHLNESTKNDLINLFLKYYNRKIKIL